MKSAASRCDRCSAKHLRCNRSFPECDTCAAIPGAECTYHRKVQRPRGDKPQYKDHVAVIHFLKRKVILRQVQDKSSDMAIILTTPSRTLMLGLISSLQYPNIHTVNSKMFLVATICQCTGLSRRSQPEALAPALATHELARLLPTAEDAFFKHVNVFLALFTRDMFYSKPRSSILKKAIILCGLHWCGNEPHIQRAKDTLLKHIDQEITPHQAPPNPRRPPDTHCTPSWPLRDTLEPAPADLSQLTDPLHSICHWPAHAIQAPLPRAHTSKQQPPLLLQLLQHHKGPRPHPAPAPPHPSRLRPHPDLRARALVHQPHLPLPPGRQIRDR
ncbi:hypothetical protein DSO57_1001092 [Entomophthora muscae]|uniref:Uncharacterized protein n=1 Tax=Entomophthora muscae TaxID=34485 RepID=A0ACC2SBA4_9FUNG|nr:hypothetical protein DSO57_1001092 [Entomophthora muscae]